MTPEYFRGFLAAVRMVGDGNLDVRACQPRTIAGARAELLALLEEGHSLTMVDHVAKGPELPPLTDEEAMMVSLAEPVPAPAGDRIVDPVAPWLRAD